MIKSNKRKANKKLSLPTKINKKAWFILGTVFSIMTFIFVVNDQTGIIGQFFRNGAFFLTGYGAYLIPLYLGLLCLVALFDKWKNKTKRNLLLIGLLILTALVLVDINMNIGDYYRVRLDHSIQFASQQKGAGALGATLAFVFYRFVGIVGTYLISAVIIFFSLLHFFNLTIRDVLEEIKETGQRLIQFFGMKIADRKRKNAGIPADSDRQLDKGSGDIDGSQVQQTTHGEFQIHDYISRQDKDFSEGKHSKQLSVEDLFIPMETDGTYITPPMELLRSYQRIDSQEAKNEVIEKAKKIEETMRNFGIESKVVDIHRGPTVTSYELEPSPGVKVSRIVSLADDLSLNLATSGIRIEAPVPGKSVVGIEVPNITKDNVFLKEILTSEEYRNLNSKLPLVLGKSISGDPIVSCIDQMPHLLIAGATGSGKSVCINAIIMSILFRSSPEDVKLLLIDPKVVELSIYNGVPHLVVPVVTEAKKAKVALAWAVSEMERRYRLFSDNSVRDITSYQKKTNQTDKEKLPYLVVIIDELADLMMIAASEVEDSICRLAQMARACGIHLIVATQRPTVDVITGTIKANIPSRISFSVSSQVDSRTILDMAGAERLLGKGDMLYYPSTYAKPIRVQGAYVSDYEVENVVDFLKSQHKVSYNQEIIQNMEKKNLQSSENQYSDDLLDEAIRIVLDEGSASISMLQRRLKIGYARAGRIIDEMEEKGLVGPHEGSKPRRVLVNRDYFDKREMD